MESEEVLFDPKTVKMLRTNYGQLPPWARPNIAEVAMDPGRGHHRRWLTEQVAQLEPDQRTEFLSRLRTSEQHQQTTVELAVGSLLSDAGMNVKYGPPVDLLTPDLAVTDRDGAESIVEVWTRSRAEGVQTALNAWGRLANVIHQIPAPALLSVESAEDGERVLTQQEIWRFATRLRTWLLRPTVSHGRLVVQGYSFAIEGQVPGMRAELLPPVFATHADSALVWDAVHRKVRRYRKAIVSRHSAFIVVLSAEPGVGLDKSHVRSALSGKNTLTLNFGQKTVGTVASRDVELRQSEARPRFDACLTAVGWIDEPLNDSRHLTLWPVPEAGVPLRGFRSSGVSVEDWPN